MPFTCFIAIAFMSLAKNNILPSTIIFEDQDLMVINKAPNIIVNDATSHQSLSLQQQLAHYLQLPPSSTNYTLTINSSPLEVFQQRQGMVHRLDKNTSGLIVWAKNPPTLMHLLTQFRTRTTNKKYHCLVHGLFNEPSGRIFLPLARKSTNRQIMAVSADGREALTTYQVIDSYAIFNFEKLINQFPTSPLKKKHLNQLYQGFSLLEVTLHTGRTHQIRAHFTHLQHPLVGDTAYLSKNKAKIDPLWCSRQFLHASYLAFIHPRTQEKLTFTSPLPQDLQETLIYLGSN